MTNLELCVLAELAQSLQNIAEALRRIARREMKKTTSSNGKGKTDGG